MRPDSENAVRVPQRQFCRFTYFPERGKCEIFSAKFLTIRSVTLGCHVVWNIKFCTLGGRQNYLWRTSYYDDTLVFFEQEIFQSNPNRKCGFGGLEVACWPLVLKFAGSNPIETVGFFRAKKILSAPTLRGEVKPSVPCCRFTACKRFPMLRGSLEFSGKIHWAILAHVVPPLAAGISWRRLVA